MAQSPFGTGDAQGRRQHTCLLYRSPEELRQYVLPFLMEGLTQGEHCLFVCAEDMVGQWSTDMQATGIDVQAHLKSGALVIATGEQWRESPFNSITKARELWQHIDEQLTVFPAVRIAGDAGWTLLDPAISSDRLCHWEATADLIYEDVPVKTVCMYDLNRQAPDAVRAALRTHSFAVVDGIARANPHYESVAILDEEPHLNASDADAALVEKMLDAVRQSQAL